MEWSGCGKALEEGIAYICTSLIDTVAFGVRGARISENAINAATAKATVVKKPKTFWTRTMAVCMIALFFLVLSCSNGDNRGQKRNSSFLRAWEKRVRKVMWPYPKFLGRDIS